MCGQGSAPTEKHSRHRLVGVALDSTCFWFLGSFPDDKAPAGSWAGSGPTERILKVSDRSIPQYLQLYKAFFPSLRLLGRRSPPDITLRRFDRCGAATDADSIAMTPNLYPPSADPQSTHLLTTTATAPPRRSCDARDRLPMRGNFFGPSRRLDASLLSVGPTRGGRFREEVRVTVQRPDRKVVPDPGTIREAAPPAQVQRCAREAGVEGLKKRNCLDPARAGLEEEDLQVLEERKEGDVL